MRYPNTITLFMEPLPPSRRPSAFAVSTVAHVVVIGLAAMGAFNVKAVAVRYPTERFSLRIVKLEAPVLQERRSTEGSAFFPVSQSVTQTPVPGGSPALAQSAPTRIPHKVQAPQILIQPDLPQDLLLDKKIPIPQILLWSAKTAQTDKVVLAPQIKLMDASVRPVIERPNTEERLADIKLVSTPIVKETPVVFASTTSPVVLLAPEQARQLPQT